MNDGNEEGVDNKEGTSKEQVKALEGMIEGFGEEEGHKQMNKDLLFKKEWTRISFKQVTNVYVE